MGWVDTWVRAGESGVCCVGEFDVLAYRRHSLVYLKDSGQRTVEIVKTKGKHTSTMQQDFRVSQKIGWTR